MATLILDPEIEKELQSEHPDALTECWNGVEVMSPLANDEHGDFQTGLAAAFYVLFQVPGHGSVRHGVNLASSHRGWKRDYRIPDVCVYLHTNPAINYDTHHVGGPDFLVEVISPGEDPHGKLEYYAEQNTREVLIVERKPWALELFKLKDGELVSSGRSRVENRKVLVSDALDLTFQLKSGPKRPVIELIQLATGVKWTI